jgi:hypothetical protein
MAKKTPAKSTKAWQPGDPLRFDQAVQKNTTENPTADQPVKADNPLFSPMGNATHPMKPANTKSHIRQKKV